jgi:hypothetical protein
MEHALQPQTFFQFLPEGQASVKGAHRVTGDHGVVHDLLLSGFNHWGAFFASLVISELAILPHCHMSVRRFGTLGVIFANFF